MGFLINLLCCAYGGSYACVLEPLIMFISFLHCIQIFSLIIKIFLILKIFFYNINTNNFILY